MAKLKGSLLAADPEARATIWAQDNVATMKRALTYPVAAELLAPVINPTKA
ncbi:hypothetical protein ACVIGA_000608 [Bradyrhizobium sp. USDA 3240]